MRLSKSLLTTMNSGNSSPPPPPPPPSAAVGLTLTVAYTGSVVGFSVSAVDEDIVIDWGDGSTSTIAAGGSASIQRHYSSNGNYDIEITGKGHLKFGSNSATRNNWTDIKHWGTLFVPTSCNKMFEGCTNIGTITATDAADFDLSNVTDMSVMFEDATNFNGDISGFNTSNVTNMADMFAFATSFNIDISSWDVGSVTDMRFIFYNATSFNQDLSGWDTSSVTVSWDFDQGANAWQSNYKPIF